MYHKKHLSIKHLSIKCKNDTNNTASDNGVETSLHLNRNQFVISLIQGGFGKWFETFASEHGLSKSHNFKIYMEVQSEMIEHLYKQAIKTRR